MSSIWHVGNDSSSFQIGNFLSMFIWCFSQNFSLFLISRIVGGLTEGNVQMSIAMIGDVTDKESRSKGMVSSSYRSSTIVNI